MTPAVTDAWGSSSAAGHERPVLVELCCGGIDDVELAAELRIPRIELNCGIALGGLTPSIGLVTEARRAFPGTIIAMLRPREGGFCYSPSEFRMLLIDARKLSDAGVDGLACGLLTRSGDVDSVRCDQLTGLKRQNPALQFVFHRAFDVSSSLVPSARRILEAGFERILTSGGHASALEGASRIRALAVQFPALQFLPGGGIRAGNVRTVLEQSGATQIHTSALRLSDDFSVVASLARPESMPLRFGTGQHRGAFGQSSRSELLSLLAELRSPGSSRP
jgi:copper homeostasis protein